MNTFALEYSKTTTFTAYSKMNTLKPWKYADFLLTCPSAHLLADTTIWLCHNEDKEGLRDNKDKDKEGDNEDKGQKWDNEDKVPGRQNQIGQKALQTDKTNERRYFLF